MNETNLVPNITEELISLALTDNCLGVTAIELGITGVSLLSTIVAAPAVIRIEVVSVIMRLLRIVGNQEIKKLSL